MKFNNNYNLTSIVTAYAVLPGLTSLIILIWLQYSVLLWEWEDFVIVGKTMHVPELRNYAGWDPDPYVDRNNIFTFSQTLGKELNTIVIYSGPVNASRLRLLMWYGHRIPILEKLSCLAYLEKLYVFNPTESHNSLNCSVIDYTVYKELPNLVSLTLTEARLNPSSYDNILNFKKLKVLRLYYCNFSDQNAYILRELKDLEELALTGTDITDKTMDSIVSLKNLKNLNLVDTKISSKGLSKIKTLKNLKKLILPTKLD